ncbi:competence/damage-inducible protein A [Francisella tularensis]|uniref:Molybdopterin binding domain protein n=2 Tax=Francisella tularensis subsp. holarctica TaxID=119857 RepID=A0AAI8FUD2_FRATH|nr:competence/damage-inducible protein A [Francisella tularensis]AFX70510.1 molybdopterin binding domain-containing protein [Francisella tularensis subsp. holarctica F92]AHH46288.1 molybdopterin-binding protein [Francisella tularensis subsp. holarctica PHIT-FT049]EBA52428.1 molybdopterin binding protein [Francisella tularensis subsp. holarctica 257]ABI82749.1 probable competence/damage inducible protein CinA [Francisella tularensis subsp. holarctica OSU18]ABU61354.1 probable molybdopterin bind
MKYDFGFIAIGDEITDGDIVNTNSSTFAKYLASKDFQIGFHVSCKDSYDDIIASLEFLKSTHKNIITIGGLGPTEDDLTTETIAKYFDKKLVLDQPSWQRLEQRMLSKYGKITLGTKKQAMFPQGSQILINTNGTANGFKLEFGQDRYIYVFPGPPKECINMLEELELTNTQQTRKIIRKRWNIYNIGESLLAEKLQVIKDVYSFVTFKYRIADSFIELKYFYPEGCPHSQKIITNVENILKDNLQS